MGALPYWSEHWTALRPHERVPDVPIVTLEETLCIVRKTRRFYPQRELRPFPTAASQEKWHIPSRDPKGSLTPLRQLKKFPDIPVCHQREHRGSHHNS